MEVGEIRVKEKRGYRKARGREGKGKRRWNGEGEGKRWRVVKRGAEVGE